MHGRECQAREVNARHKRKPTNDQHSALLVHAIHDLNDQHSALLVHAVHDLNDQHSALLLVHAVHDLTDQHSALLVHAVHDLNLEHINFVAEFFRNMYCINLQVLLLVV